MIISLLHSSLTEPTATIVKNASLAENTIQIMGLSFVLGCLFTVLMLFVLDVIRRRPVDKE